jgi:hypothetical protein
MGLRSGLDIASEEKTATSTKSLTSLVQFLARQITDTLDIQKDCFVTFQTHTKQADED